MPKGQYERKKTQNGSVCLICGSTENIFYKSSNHKYSFFGKIPFCQVCINNIYSEWVIKTSSPMEALVETCREIDIPFNFKWAETSISTAQERDFNLIGIYIKNINSFGSKKNSNVGRCFEDSIFPKEIDENSVDDISEITSHYIKWGKGLGDLEDYLFLDEELEEWCKTHKSDTRSEVNLLKEICIKALEIRKAREKGEDTIKLVSQYQELMKTAAVSPNMATVAQGGKSMDAYGVWIKDIESTKPAEWFEEQEKYKDMDGFNKYIKDYILRPIKNFITGSRDFNVDKELMIDLGGDDA